MLTEDAGNGRSLLEELAAESSSADLGEADVDGTDPSSLPLLAPLCAPLQRSDSPFLLQERTWWTYQGGRLGSLKRWTSHQQLCGISTFSSALKLTAFMLHSDTKSNPEQGNHALRSADIVSLLVDIYGSKELFVTEYRAMLAERLLTKAAYDTDREVRTLELLKLRFGDEAMLLCDVMLKDMADSKRIDSNIKAAAGLSSGLETTSATILSSLFWPALGEPAPAKGSMGLACRIPSFYLNAPPQVRRLPWSSTCPLQLRQSLLPIGKDSTP